MNYHIITFGCQMNKSDSERIATFLENANYSPTSNINEADLIVVNMCSVRQSAVDRVYGKLNQISKIKNQNGKSKCKIVLTGCILPKDKKKLKNRVDLVLDIKDLASWPKLLSSIFYDRRKNIPEYRDYLEIKPRYQNNSSAFVPIMTGCNNFCAYCVVPYTRGREISKPAEEIIWEVKNLIKRGYREIILLGQNVNSYKFKMQKSKIKMTIQNSKLFKNQKTIIFPLLLKILNEIKGDFRIRFSTSHPKDMSEELIETIANCEKVVKEIHLPVQSGDNEILKKMNRDYTVAHYKNLIRKIRQKIPGVKISTDVIVGFPGETKKQFENTIKLFKEIKFDRAYIAKYSPRPGTAAFKLKDNVPLEEKKRREKILREIINEKI